MGVSYDRCGNPDCGGIVCDHDPNLEICERCLNEFCGDRPDSCDSVVKLSCEENGCWEQTMESSERYHEDPPHVVCVKCIQGSWPSERFNAFLLKRAGFITMKEARDAFNELQTQLSEEDSEAEYISANH